MLSAKSKLKEKSKNEKGSRRRLRGSPGLDGLFGDGRRHRAQARRTNPSSNLLAGTLLEAAVSVAPVFTVWFNVSFDGRVPSARMERWLAVIRYCKCERAQYAADRAIEGGWPLVGDDSGGNCLRQQSAQAQDSACGAVFALYTKLATLYFVGLGAPPWCFKQTSRLQFLCSCTRPRRRAGLSQPQKKFFLCFFA